MAYEKLGANTFTATMSTGLRQYRGVRLTSTGGLGYPSGSTARLAIVGVLISSGSTSSTTPGSPGTVQVDGIAKIEAAASTVSVGDPVAISTAGQVVALTANDFCVGRVVAGSSGSANRLLSVLLQPLGSTVAPT